MNLEKVGEFGTVGELLVGGDALSDAVDIEVVVAGDDVEAKLAEDVVIGSGAMFTPWAEALHEAALIKLE